VSGPKGFHGSKKVAGSRYSLKPHDRAVDPDRMIAWLLRVVASLLAVAMIVGVFAGCGGSGPLAATATAKRMAPITKAEAVAYARAVNLRVGDIPLGSVYKGESEAKRSSLTPREAACEGAKRGPGHRSTRIIKRQSATLGWSVPGEFQRIYSAVQVLPTAALMVRHNAANRSPRSLTCASRFLPSIIRKAETGRLEFSRATVSRLPDPLPGIEGAYEYRMAATIIIGRSAPVEPVDYVPQQVKRIRFYLDFFGFVSGPAEINMTTLSAPRPVPRKVEDRLLVLLYSRTQAHRL
jgi:hypothetical protein